MPFLFFKLLFFLQVYQLGPSVPHQHLIGSHLQLVEVIHQVFQELGLQVASLALSWKYCRWPGEKVGKGNSKAGHVSGIWSALAPSNFPTRPSAIFPTQCKRGHLESE